MAKRKADDVISSRTTTRRSTRQATNSQPASVATLKTDAPAKKAKIEKKIRSPVETPKLANRGRKSSNSTDTPSEKVKAAPPPSASSEDQQYWLMKAEPESRIEKGHDVRFSIDDLASRTEPEPWDGIRNYVARNNLRAMKKGDLSFFYHSNCKEPGIVGVMEIMSEHEPDVTAYDPSAAYYDPKDDPKNPKWSIVKVEFRRKFRVPIGLKELKELGASGGPLADMQMLRQSRLSVSKVSATEWKYLLDLLERRESETG